MDIDDRRNIHLYQSLLTKHGDSYKALDWGSRESQIRRFEVLTDIGMIAGDHILDVGCGLADLNAWLIENKPGIKYSGIDLTPNMTKKAKARFPDTSIENKTVFDLDTTIEIYDYVVASGIFVFRKDGPERYLCSTVQKMFEICKKGVAFNSLSSWAKMKSSNEYYADPLRVIEFSKNLTSTFVLRHDYHVGDFTVFLYKEGLS